MSKEQNQLDYTVQFLRQKLKSNTLSLDEKRVCLFYLNELKTLTCCPDEERFRPFHKCIGGTGDRMVFQKFVLRDKNNNICLNSDNSLKSIICGFQDFQTYLQYIRGEKEVHPRSFAFYNGIPQADYIEIEKFMLNQFGR